MWPEGSRQKAGELPSIAGSRNARRAYGKRLHRQQVGRRQAESLPPAEEGGAPAGRGDSKIPRQESASSTETTRSDDKTPQHSGPARTQSSRRQEAPEG